MTSEVLEGFEMGCQWLSSLLHGKSPSEVMKRKPTPREQQQQEV
jgi:hypothetical protein